MFTLEAGTGENKERGCIRSVCSDEHGKVLGRKLGSLRLKALTFTCRLDGCQ